MSRVEIDREVVLGDIVTDVRPGFACGDNLVEGTIQFRMNNVSSDGRIDWSKIRRVPSDRRATQLLVNNGDILFNNTNSPDLVGKCAVFREIGEPVTFSNHFLRLRINTNKADSSYVQRYLFTVWARGEFRNMCKQWINQATVSKDLLLNLSIPLLPLPEQKRIAAILDSADAIRQKRKAAIAKLDDLAQSMFLAMFGDLVHNSLGLPIHPLGELCDVRDGTHDSPKYVDDDGFPLVTSKNLSSGYLDLSDVNYISVADYDLINKRSKVDIGDIIMPMIGTIGSPVLIEEEPHFAIKNVALIKFRNSSPHPKYIRHLLSYEYFDYIVKQINKGGTQKFISLGDIRAFPIPLATIAMQKKFVEKTDVIGVIRKKYQLARISEDRLFSSLQHRAFAGEL